MNETCRSLNIQIFKNLCFLNLHAGPTTQRVTIAPLLFCYTNENYAFTGIK